METKYLFLNLSILYTLLSVNVNSCSKKEKKEFEGKIIFENTMKCGDVERDSFYYNSFGRFETFTYSKGNYMSEFPQGHKYSKVLYNNESNNYYSFFKNHEISFSNCSEESDSIVKIIRNPKKELICGYNCESIKFDFGRFSMTYFYTSNLPINSDHFKNHQFQHFNRLFKETQSQYLKKIMEFENMSFTTTAVKIEQNPIEIERFAKPKKAKKN